MLNRYVIEGCKVAKTDEEFLVFCFSLLLESRRKKNIYHILLNQLLAITSSQ